MDSETRELLDKGQILPLMELFYTLQGEGFHTGEAAVFIRIGGCDVGCKWCDVKESWDPSLHPLTPVDDIIASATAFPAPNVVITGGEPLMYNLDALCKGLKDKGLQIFLETSGTEKFSGKWDWICLSPKVNMEPLNENLSRADELKVIIENDSDFEKAESWALQVSAGCRLFLQPEWSQRHSMTPAIVDYIQSNPRWKLSLQMHKYIGIP